MLLSYINHKPYTNRLHNGIIIKHHIAATIRVAKPMGEVLDWHLKLVNKILCHLIERLLIPRHRQPVQVL